jgi:putative ABC transport system ATP-binding protein
MNAVELRAVWKMRGAGRQSTQAVTDVSLAVEPGDLTLLEGPSGSGKTTLLALAAGLLTPDRGEVLLTGERMAALSPRARRRLRAVRVGFVFQRPNLLSRITIFENVLISAQLAGLGSADGAKEASALLGSLGIGHLAERYPGDLSGGEEQRVAVARAMVHRPAVIFADEPTASLDSASGAAVAECLQRLARERGSAVLVATHDARLEPFASNRARIVDGKIVS